MVLDHAPTGVASVAPLADGLVVVTKDEGLSVLQFGPEARNSGMRGFPGWPFVWIRMFDEILALLVGVEVAVEETDIAQLGAVVVVAAADAHQPRLASAGAGVESGFGLQTETKVELV